MAAWAPDDQGQHERDIADAERDLARLRFARGRDAAHQATIDRQIQANVRALERMRRAA